MLCGTELCEDGKVCCLTKSPPLAMCIDPSNFQALHCETMALPCFKPKDCPMGLTCCLGLQDFTVTCRPQILCPGDGVETVIACEVLDDCPFNAPSCNFLTEVMGMNFNVCGPVPSAAEDQAFSAEARLRAPATPR